MVIAYLDVGAKLEGSFISPGMAPGSVHIPIQEYVRTREYPESEGEGQEAEIAIAKVAMVADALI